MAASFPNAKKTFSQIVNGVTKLVAAIFNVNYDETEAIETFIGATGGGAQSYSTSLTDLLRNYREACEVEYKGTADLYVRAGEILITDASGNRRLRRNPNDTTVDLTTSTTYAAGAEAASTTYYVYACADTNATTFTVKLSTSASAAESTTYGRLIGCFYNNASGNIEDVANLSRHLISATPALKAQSTTYLALTDGIARGVRSTGGGVEIYSDSANPPTTLIERAYTDGSNLTIAHAHIKKGNYWRVAAASTVYWEPTTTF